MFPVLGPGLQARSFQEFRFVLQVGVVTFDDVLSRLAIRPDDHFTPDSVNDHIIAISSRVGGRMRFDDGGDVQPPGENRHVACQPASIQTQAENV